MSHRQRCRATVQAAAIVSIRPDARMHERA
jgi:hypothetical protein